MPKALRPPQKYSVDEDREARTQIGHLLRIELNGKEVTRVLSYDCIEGVLTRIKTDKQDTPMLNMRKDEVLTETLHGDVVAKWKDD